MTLPTIRTGVDIVDVAGLSATLARSPHLRDELFDPAELAYCDARKDPLPHLAARLAAKEALVKCFGLDALGYELFRLWVARGPDGRPRMVIDCERFLADARGKLGCERFDVDVSLSHDGGMAIASVVIIAAAAS